MNMNSANDQEDLMDFRRQPKPILVAITGNIEDIKDVRYWVGLLRNRSEFKGDNTNIGGEVANSDGTFTKSFTIYPRAVND